MTRPDTITLAGVEMRLVPSAVGTSRFAASPTHRIVASHHPVRGWTSIAFGTHISAPTLEALDAAVRAALAETFRSLLPLVPAEVEAIRAEERERCAAVVKQPHDETRTLWSTHVAVTHERNEMAARIRALGPVQP